MKSIITYFSIIYNMKKALIFLLLIACGSPQESTQESLEEPTHRISGEEFGKLPDGTSVQQYTLANANGIEMKVITYGGIITHLTVPDRNGNYADVVLGYDSLHQYLEMNPYFGAIIGRYGNRIAKGEFSLNGETYELARNNIGNHLHGGIQGFDKVVWQAELLEMDDAVGLKLSYTSEDMEEGYPGTLSAIVTYILDNQNRLTFDYEAVTDKTTIVNLTNHAYYNLSGMSSDILGHELTINADSYLPVDSTLIPLQAEFVEGTPFDFRISKVIGADIGKENIQLQNGGGYDHCWILNEEGEELSLAATLYDPESGRQMEVYTTEPGIQFYSGNFLDGSITGKNGVVYGKRSGLCLETQHFPDSPNRPDFPSTVLNPGEVYRSKTVTVFTGDN